MSDYVHMKTYVMVTIILTLWSSGLVVLLAGRRHGAVAVTIGRLTAVLASGAALGNAIATSAGADSSGGWIMVDRLGAGVVVFVTVMAVIVGSFASRSLAADPRAHRFFAATNLLTGSTVLLAVAGRPWMMATGWIAVSLSTIVLIAYDGRPGARSAARRAAKVFVVGDLGIIAGTALATVASDAGTLSATASDLASSGGWVALTVGALLTTAALARSAQLPFSGWLAASVEAPTPVSAMLHAGVVNGSAILLIRWHPLMAGSTVITVTTVLIAVAGILIGMAIGRTRPDVKSGLAWTTVAQMAFMTLQCALGLVGPAVVHLMAHGLFKSSLFLGAGSGLDGPGLHQHPSRSRPRATLIVAAATTAAATVGLGLAAVRPEFLQHPAGLLPAAFATMTIAYGLLQWWTRSPAAGSWTLRLAPVPVVLVAFTALTALSSTVDHWIAAAAGTAAPSGAAWLAGAAVVMVGVVATGAGAIDRRLPGLAGRTWILLAAASAPTRTALRRLVSASPTADGHPAESADQARRAETRTTVVTAASDIARSWPLERFVATNPLLSSEHLPLEEAVDRAARDLGVRAELDEETYRAHHAEGRISAAELRSSALDFLAVGQPGIKANDLAVDDLLDKLLQAPAQHVPTTRPILLSEWHDQAAGTKWAETVDELSAWWCAAYLSDHPASPLPGRANGLFSAWRSLVAGDPRPGRTIGASFAELLAELPDRADDAVTRLLDELGVDRLHQGEYLGRHLHRHHGWTSALIAASGADGEDLIGYLAIRLAFEAALLRQRDALRLARQTASERRTHTGAAGAANRLPIWREAYELGYRDQLLASLAPLVPSRPEPSDAPTRPTTQVVFCIDPRSEGLRRHLEAVGPHETIGFAGFFGLPVAISDIDGAAPVASCPVIVEPQATVVETETGGSAGRKTRLTAVHSAHDVFATAKRSAAAPFVLAETLGWVSGLVTAAQTLAPAATATAARSLRRTVVPDATTMMVPDSDNWWTLDEQVAIAASILRATGLHHNPARLVMLCGHTSRHVNNLHRSSLACGACGGRGGANNARTAANLLNNPEVRSGLIALGIELGDDTHFVAAEHDTTSDRVGVLDRELVPASHQTTLSSLELDLDQAGNRLAVERSATLPSTVGRTVSPKPALVQRRGDDWAQVIPERGLVANAALIIGPRSLTAQSDLERRVFLHTYDASDDRDAAILANIMAGPLQVAHWISSQYRLSTIDPDRLGAGTKTAHNLVGGVGVIEGGGGDIRIGLPAESLRRSGDDVHEAMRLLVVVDAPAELVEQALGAAESVAMLARNGWIRIAARPGDGVEAATPWALLARDGSWSPWILPTEPDRPANSTLSSPSHASKSSLPDDLLV